MDEGGGGSGRSERGEGIAVAPALQVLADLRGSRHIVVASMGSVRAWAKLSHHPLDFHYLPSTMGGAAPLALGLALARPDREVIVLSGDGSLLMSLGSLVTAAASGARNLTLVLLDNGLYEVTGGQRTAGAVSRADYGGLARAAGFPNVGRFRELADWRRRAPEMMVEPGPRFVWLAAAPVVADEPLAPPQPMPEQIRRFTAALSADTS